MRNQHSNPVAEGRQIGTSGTLQVLKENLGRQRHLLTVLWLGGARRVFAAGAAVVTECADSGRWKGI